MSESVASSPSASSAPAAAPLQSGKRGEKRSLEVLDATLEEEKEDTQEAKKKQKTTDTTILPSTSDATAAAPIALDDASSTTDVAAAAATEDTNPSDEPEEGETVSMTKEEMEVLKKFGHLPQGSITIVDEHSEPVKKRRGGRKEGASGYDESSLKDLIAIYRSYVPTPHVKIGAGIWNKIASDYNAKTNQSRSGEAIRKKFESMREDIDEWTPELITAAMEASKTIADIRHGYPSTQPAAAAQLAKPAVPAVPWPLTTSNLLLSAGANIPPPTEAFHIVPPAAAATNRDTQLVLPMSPNPLVNGATQPLVPKAPLAPLVLSGSPAASMSLVPPPAPFAPLAPLAPLAPVSFQPRPPQSSSATAVESLIEAQQVIAVQIASLKQELQQVVALLQVSNEKQASHFVWQNLYFEQHTKLLERLVALEERRP